MADIETTSTITNIEMTAESIRYSGRGVAGKYGSVMFTHCLEPTQGNIDQGKMSGFVRTVLDDGSSVEATQQGVWRRVGSSYKVFSLDEGNNGDANLIEIDIDILTGEMKVQLNHLDW